MRDAKHELIYALQRTRAASDELEFAMRRLEDAEVLLTEAHKAVECTLNKDPRFLKAQEEFGRLDAEAGRRTSQRAPQDLTAAIQRLVSRFGPVEGKRLASDNLTSLPDAELHSRAQTAYQAIARIIRSIATGETAALEISAADSRRRVEAATDNLERLQQQLKSAEASVDQTRFRRREPSATPMSDEAHPVPPIVVNPTSVERLEAYSRERCISALVHFTRLANLPSILQHGLIPRAELEQASGTDVAFNDTSRLDRRPDCSCLSITRINTQMYYVFSKQRFPYAVWCIITMDPSVLWCKHSLFCSTNAATAGAVAQAESNGWSVEGLRSLFSDPAVTPGGKVARSGLVSGGLPRNVTSNPQAEVLVCGRIEPSFIRSITVKDCFALMEARQHAAAYKVPVTLDKGAFARRRDYRYWTNRDRR